MLPPFGYVHTPCSDKARSEESVLARIQSRVVGGNTISEAQARAEGIIIWTRKGAGLMDIKVEIKSEVLPTFKKV